VVAPLDETAFHARPKDTEHKCSDRFLNAFSYPALIKKLKC